MLYALSLSTYATCICFYFSNALPFEGIKDYRIKSLGGRGSSPNDYQDQFMTGINQLQTWYDDHNGLWDSAWWPSANIITMMADFQEHFPSNIAPITDHVFPNTLHQAPTVFPNFINEYYDDELWWALAWIKVYDVTSNPVYLDTAAAIFEDSKNMWGQTPCGGLWWDKQHSQINAVENELYLTTAAKLANRRPSNPSPYYYLNEATKATTWFRNSGLINEHNLINDGLSLGTCSNNGNFVFSYNQGTILSGLLELTWATQDRQYANLAHTLAEASISALTDSEGILHEPCEPNACNSDEEQFKGIFIRNVQFLFSRDADIPAANAAIYKKFIQTNADSIWARDNANGRLGLVWSGPNSEATVQTQGSALDAIVSAANVS
ncbi:BgTH12-04271 [Blumeria graminis f. sp. triticale]|uniref:Bgt-4674 n=3 Tax=Blumeria graminis TaxID=34373 RepID=A0A061HL34_BLUGR|nr:mannosidase GPI-anchored membrane protein [Blumeria graminis f. sp. tritici 96224]CAD6500164.1 BgTH12-04267 [Blumeria graminis f. sp. triticale]CAD6500168.1 BgTH12-04271 [Blumeria graminis f. sp. triticale]VCU40405.1 Bgt-4674 [Blumeria graminis f. sp. tritici]